MNLSNRTYCHSCRSYIFLPPFCRSNYWRSPYDVDINQCSENLKTGKTLLEATNKFLNNFDMHCITLEAFKLSANNALYSHPDCREKFRQGQDCTLPTSEARMAESSIRRLGKTILDYRKGKNGHSLKEIQEKCLSDDAMKNGEWGWSNPLTQTCSKNKLSQCYFPSLVAMSTRFYNAKNFNCKSSEASAGECLFLAIENGYELPKGIIAEDSTQFRWVSPVKRTQAKCQNLYNSMREGIKGSVTVWRSKDAKRCRSRSDSIWNGNCADAVQQVCEETPDQTRTYLLVTFPDYCPEESSPCTMWLKESLV